MEPQENYDGDSTPPSEDEHSFSAGESLVSSLSDDETQRHTNTLVAIQMSTLQASFAEKTAEEMQQIVDWYSSIRAADRFTKVIQSQSLPDNPLACIDDDYAGRTSPNRNNGRLDLLSKDRVCNLSKKTSREKKISTDYPPDLASSPTSMESLHSTSPSSSWEAQQQLQEVEHLLQATKCMAVIVLEYEQLSSASDRELHTLGITTTRRRRPRQIKPHAVLEHAGIRSLKHRKQSSTPNCACQLWRVTVVLLGVIVAWYSRGTPSETAVS